MNSRKPLILVVAALLAALAVFVLYNYVNGLKDKAYGNAKRVTVYIVHSPIAKGTPASQTTGLIVKSSIPKQWYPPNAITDLTEIAGQVAVSDLSPNQILVDGNFASPSQVQFSLSSELKQIRNTDQVAITIAVPGEAQSVAGLIVPGDYVNIMVTSVSSVSASGGAGAASAGTTLCGTAAPPGVNPDDILFCNQARYVYEKVEVLAVGQNAIPQVGSQESTVQGATGTSQPQQNTNTGLITLIVPVKAAQYIASLPAQNIYLSLVAQDFTPIKTGKIDPAAPLPAENPVYLTPYGPKGPTS